MLKEKLHEEVYFYSLVLLAVSLPLSLFMISVSQFLLLTNWMLEGRFKEKFFVLSKNKFALLLVSFFVLHLVGLIYTSDFSNAMNDIRVKLPILLLPVLTASSRKISLNKINSLLCFFIFAVTVASLISLYRFINYDISDIRQISPFISHIRFALLICISVFSLFYLIFINSQLNKFQKLLSFILSGWLIFFLVLMESITGIFILLVNFMFILIYIIVKNKNLLIRSSLTLLILIILVGIFFYLKPIYNSVYSTQQTDISKLPSNTDSGNLYTHNLLNKETENGYYVWLYVCEDELRNEWNKRSKYYYDSLDQKKQEIKYTLIRFLTSKGFTKDAAGVRKLNEAEINSVEKGIANVLYQQKSNIGARIHQILWEVKVYNQKDFCNNHSVAQRFEFWKASFGIIKQNFWVGVGTGDIKIAFNDEYIKMKSSLSKENRWHSHNQFLTIFVAFGVFGFLLFVLIFFYPIVSGLVKNDFLYYTFFITALLSMLSEDTLETQAGVTFFMFFTSLLVFVKQKDK
ncbi:MAG: O-antigen ligase family protein [Bacteroidales bacterium]|nr:O-antigen ligase family protein [Bacteroidales bacterium]